MSPQQKQTQIHDLVERMVNMARQALGKPMLERTRRKLQNAQAALAVGISRGDVAVGVR